MSVSRRRAAALLLAAATLARSTARAADVPFWRVHDTRAGRTIGYEDFLRRLAASDAIFVGEEHDDPETHRAELWLLENLHRRWGQKLTLAMEMFERDSQAALDDYLAGRSTEAQLGKTVALWSNYNADYRPLVEYARARRVPVVGSNVPRRIARDVSQNGAAATLAKLPAAQKSFVAAFTNAPDDAYFSRFKAILGEGHGGGTTLDDNAVRRFYQAQCLKDDTMAESVVRALETGRLVLHVNGTFHSDAGLGIPARVLWRKPVSAPRLTLVKIVPVKNNLAAADAGKWKNEADFLLFVSDRRKPENKEP